MIRSRVQQMISPGRSGELLGSIAPCMKSITVKELLRSSSAAFPRSVTRLHNDPSKPRRRK